jgi:membrane protease YdiL (CAAX protease family)
MMGTWILRAPQELARGLVHLAPLTALSPGALIARPLAAFAQGGAASVASSLGLLAVAAAAALVLAMAVARRAGARGWEEAGATWAEAEQQPAERADRRPLTAATKDLALITRDRGLLVALIAMPTIFVGMQLFGAAGWAWSTASLQRVSYLSFSLMLYMATIGPLTHMQAERRAFWILRSVPVPIGRLLAAKARAWSVLVGGGALAVFAGLSLGAPVPSAAEWFRTALLVVGGAVGMTWLAVAVASRAADLSDDQRPAIGPATIYTFLLVGGLYNTVLAGDLATRACAIILYAFTLGAYWVAGVEQARVCLDPELAPARRIVVADGATMVVVFALGQRGARAAVDLAATVNAVDDRVVAIARGALVGAVGLAALGYLARRPRAVARAGLAASAGIAIGAGAAVGFVLRVAGLPPAGPVLWVAASMLAEELIFRGVIQRGLEEQFGARLGARAAAAALSVLVALVANASSASSVSGLGAVVATHIVAAGTHVVTGRTLAAWLARVAVMIVATVAFAS